MSMVHPLICRKCLQLKIKLFIVSMCFIKVANASVGGSLDILLFRHCSWADIPSLCFIFEYRDLTFIIARIALFGTVVIYFILFSRSVMSRM